MSKHIDLKLSDIGGYNEKFNTRYTPTSLKPSAESTNKIPLVLFSGGVDSTFLLVSILNERKSNNSRPFGLKEDSYNGVDVLYAMGGQSYLKANAELLQRRKIISYINRYYGRRTGILRDYIPSASFRLTEFQPRWQLSQGLPWLLAALQAFDPQRHSNIVIGYLLDDSIMKILPDLKKTWESICRITNYIGDAPIPELSFPFIDEYYWGKRDVLNAMLEQSDDHMYMDLYKLTWVCELPTHLGADESDLMPCNRCPACEKHLYTLAGLRYPEFSYTSKKVDACMSYQKHTSVNNRSLVATYVDPDPVPVPLSVEDT